MKVRSISKISFLQSLTVGSHLSNYLRFVQGLKQTEQIQKNLLKKLIRQSSQTEVGRHYKLESIQSYEELTQKIGVSSYSDWEPWIENQMRFRNLAILAKQCPRFEPTSGSTQKRKWIPYTPELMSEFDQAASAWIFDLSSQYPKILQGRHFWSLSWLPTELRSELHTTSDLHIFSLGKQFLMNRIMSVPESISRLPTSDKAMLASLCYLAATTDLTLISVWSPTYFLQILNRLKSQRELIAQILETGKWEILELKAPFAPHQAKVLREAPSNELAIHLWPNLNLISSWNSSTSEVWAKELRDLFPNVNFQGKGYWTTEGVVTIPFRKHYPLAVTSHFYEFRCLDSNQIIPSWKLRVGQMVQPIISTGSGLWRYALNDRLKVTGFLKTAPCFHFEGRLHSIDLVGEKMDVSSATTLLKEMEYYFNCHCISLLAKIPKKSGSPPQYVLLAQEKSRSNSLNIHLKMAEYLEKKLLEHHHYQVARELGQLNSADVVLSPNALQFYLDLSEQSGRSAGNVKIEPLLLWSER